MSENKTPREMARDTWRYVATDGNPRDDDFYLVSLVRCYDDESDEQIMVAVGHWQMPDKDAPFPCWWTDPPTGAEDRVFAWRPYPFAAFFEPKRDLPGLTDR